MGAHHVAALASVALAGLSSQGHNYTLALLATECTTPFVNARWFLDAAGLREARVYVANGVALLCAWFVGRILLFLAFFHHVYRHAYQIPLVRGASGFCDACTAVVCAFELCNSLRCRPTITMHSGHLARTSAAAGRPGAALHAQHPLVQEDPAGRRQDPDRAAQSRPAPQGMLHWREFESLGGARQFLCGNGGLRSCLAPLRTHAHRNGDRCAGTILSDLSPPHLHPRRVPGPLHAWCHRRPSPWCPIRSRPSRSTERSPEILSN